MLRRLLVLAVVLAVTSPAYAKRKVAFLVGVGEFKHDLPNLNGAPQKDVTELAKVLKAGGFEIVVLMDKDATRENIEKKFKGTLDGPGGALGKDDVLLVGVCTHGFTLPQGEGQPDAPFLAGYDARIDDAKTMVPLNGLIATAKPFGPTTLFLIDACREVKDANRGQTRGVEGMQVTLPKGTAVLFSCGRGQVAHQSDRAGGHGLFTYAVLKALRADDGRGDEITWNTLVTEVEKTFRSAEFRKMIPAGKPQTPFEARGELSYTDLIAPDAFATDAAEYLAALMNGPDDQMKYLKDIGSKRAAAWKAAAENGKATAMVLFGHCCACGEGTDHSDDEAFRWYTKAADAGNMYGMYSLGGLYADARGVAKSDAKAFEWYKKAADAGHKMGFYRVGWAHENGLGVEKSLYKAAEAYKKSANAGYPLAMTSYGWALSNGQGVVEDTAEGAKWYKKAADLGEPTAMYNYGWALAHGKGVARNDEEAVKWYHKAANGKNVSALCNLGHMYVNGLGVKTNEAEGFRWYMKSAEAGDAFGMYGVGWAYENGKGVTASASKAREWFEKAAKLGNDQAKEGLKRLSKDD